MIHLYNNGEETLFIASVVVYGLSYVGQELCFVKKPIYLILSLIGLSWFRLPYSIKFGKQSVYAVFATIFEMIALIYGGVQNAYFIYQNRIIPLYYSIPFFVIVCLILPLHYGGTLFSTEQTIPLKHYLFLVFEVFMTYSLMSVCITMYRYWVIFCCFAWRFFMLYEPYAFWSTLHTFVSPYRAFAMSQNARSLIVIYLLHFEYFLIVYCAIWFMKLNLTNRIIVYFCAAYFVLYLIIEIFAPSFPFTHKVKSIYSAKQPLNPGGPAIM